MMAAMMLPSALPLLMLYDVSLRRGSRPRHVSLHVASLAAGYVLIWALFSVGATMLQRVLSRALIVNPMMEMSSGMAIGLTLLLAGGYQFTPLKRRCLRHCRSPLSFVMQRWRSGAGGALRMGLEHGAYCVGCCWALMLLLFAGGVMNLTIIVGLTIVVLVERVMPFGASASRALGIVLLAAGTWMLVR
jgi:predicted metal-binding membrane protein